MTYRLFSGVSQRRIADVVGQSGGGDDGADVTGSRASGIEVFADEYTGRRTQTASDGTGFEAVGEPGADIVGLDLLATQKNARCHYD